MSFFMVMLVIVSGSGNWFVPIYCFFSMIRAPPAGGVQNWLIFLFK